jgi:hypothetical protein
MDIGDFFRFIFQWTGRGSALERNVRFLKSQISPLKEKLIPFSLQEAGLISHQCSHVKGKINRRNGLSGIIDTIYYEHLFAWAARQFQKNELVILVESTEDVFLYIVKNDIFRVVMNGVEAGYIDSQGRFYNKSHQLIAYWDQKASSPTQHIEILEKKVGIVHNYASADITTPRLLNIFSELSEDENSILMCLILGKLVYDNSKKP